MKELGEYLKEQREINGINLDEAADDLSISVMELENIEAGNTRAFKDIYNLRDMIKKYAKYLGLDVKKVALEFNDFLFEHTSKISLDDILEAKKRIEEKEEKKIQSPYTKEYKEKFNYRPLIYTVGIIAIIIILGYLIITLLNKKPVHNEVLRGINKEDVYEFAY